VAGADPAGPHHLLLRGGVLRHRPLLEEEEVVVVVLGNIEMATVVRDDAVCTVGVVSGEEAEEVLAKARQSLARPPQ
jgi:hypothetical protein